LPRPGRAASLARHHLPRLLLLVATLASCTYDADPGPLPVGGGVLLATSTTPAAGAVGVPIDAPVDVFFSRPIDAPSLDRTDFRLFSGRSEFAGTIEVDLLESRVRFTPSAPLRPLLRHQAWISDRLRGLDASTLASPLVFEFTTGEQTGGAPAPRPAVSAADVQPIWQRSCTACHGPPVPVAGVDLSSIAAAERTAVGVASSASALLRVAPGDHARSYLMRKLIGSLGFVGLPMPPTDLLPAAQLRTIADWIDSGAE